MATDYYDQCEAAAMTKLRSLSAFFPNPKQVSSNLGDLLKGFKYFAHFIPSTFSTSRANGREKDIVWTILFDLHVKYSTQKESIPLFKAVRAEVFYLYNSDPLLNKTPGVSNVAISAASEILQDLPGNNPTFLIQTMALAVSQRIRFGF
jgi:hypothetical protein